MPFGGGGCPGLLGGPSPVRNGRRLGVLPGSPHSGHLPRASWALRGPGHLPGPSRPSPGLSSSSFAAERPHRLPCCCCCCCCRRRGALGRNGVRRRGPGGREEGLSRWARGARGTRYLRLGPAASRERLPLKPGRGQHGGQGDGHRPTGPAPPPARPRSATHSHARRRRRSNWRAGSASQRLRPEGCG